MLNQASEFIIGLVEIDDYILKTSTVGSLLLINKLNYDVIILSELNYNELTELEKIDFKDKANLDICVEFKKQLKEKKLRYAKETTQLICLDHIFSFSTAHNGWIFQKIDSYIKYPEIPIAEGEFNFLNNAKKYFQNSRTYVTITEIKLLAINLLITEIDAILLKQLHQSPVKVSENKVLDATAKDNKVNRVKLYKDLNINNNFGITFKEFLEISDEIVNEIIVVVKGN